MHATFCPLLILSLSGPLLTTATSLFARAEVNGPCTGGSGNPGVCVATAACTKAGGSFISDACPNTPPDIKCCTKPACGTGKAGNCRFTSSCTSGVTETNQCPGPASFKCCMPKGSTTPPKDPPFGKAGCKQVAIDGAAKIVAQFPGKILEIGCKRSCSDGSDHCVGMANDLMVAKLGDRTQAGQPIAQWISEHAGTLNLKYVMWGQRIWNPSDGQKPWSQWRFQDPKDRGGNTANHWDHVHVSYK